MPTLFIINNSTDQFDLIPTHTLLDTKNHSSDISFHCLQFYPHLFSIWILIHNQSSASLSKSFVSSDDLSSQSCLIPSFPTLHCFCDRSAFHLFFVGTVITPQFDLYLILNWIHHFIPTFISPSSSAYFPFIIWSLFLPHWLDLICWGHYVFII